MEYSAGGRRFRGAWALGVFIAVAVVGVAVFGSTAAPARAATGDWTNVSVATGGDVKNPWVDDGWIIFVRESGATHTLMAFDCATGATRAVAELGASSDRGILDDGRVAYLASVGGQPQVFVFDLVSWTGRQMTTAPGGVSDYGLAGPILSWRTGSGDASNVYCYDFDTDETTHIYEDSHVSGGPIVADGFVAWTGHYQGPDEEVLLYESFSMSTTITDNTYEDGDPATSSGNLVYRAHTRQGIELVLYDALSDTLGWLTTNKVEDGPAAVEADMAAWVQSPGTATAGVLLTRLPGGQEQQLAAVGVAAGSPVLDLGAAAWVDPVPGLAALCVYDPARALPVRLGPLGQAAGSPDMDGGLVAWTTGTGDGATLWLGTRESAFPDVPAYHLHGSAISELARREVIGGYAGGGFGPNDPVIRQQFAKMIVLSLMLPVSEADVCPFSDVDVSGPGELYPDNYVAVAAARGITQGTGGGMFSPWNRISRAQVISMVVRSIQTHSPRRLRTPPAGYRGTWGDFGSTHAANVKLAEYNHLLDGLRMRGIDPWGEMTRGEVSQVLYNMVNYLGIAPAAG